MRLRLSNFTFTFHFHALEKEMAPHSSTLVSLPLGLALGSPIFPSGCEGKLGVALESLQGIILSPPFMGSHQVPGLRQTPGFRSRGDRWPW